MQEMAVVVLTGLACGAAAHWLHPDIPWRGTWARHVEAVALDEGFALAGLREAERAVSDSAVLLDARRETAYRRGHLPGALSLPAREAAERFGELAPALDPADRLVVYCGGPDCDESLLLARFLRSAGWTNLVLFAGGFRDWQAAGFAVETSP